MALCLRERARSVYRLSRVYFQLNLDCLTTRSANEYLFTKGKEVSMRRLRVLSRPWNLLAIVLFVGASLSLLWGLLWPALPTSRRAQAQRLWSERKFSDYRVSVRVEYWGSVCSQDIETRGEQLHRIVRNDCRLSWLSLMTIARLFEISENLEHPIPCYVAAQTCS